MSNCLMQKRPMITQWSYISFVLSHHIIFDTSNCSMQKGCNSSALALELCLFCVKPSTWYPIHWIISLWWLNYIMRKMVQFAFIEMSCLHLNIWEDVNINAFSKQLSSPKSSYLSEITKYFNRAHNMTTLMEYSWLLPFFQGAIWIKMFKGAI